MYSAFLGSNPSVTSIFMKTIAELNQDKAKLDLEIVKMFENATALTEEELKDFGEKNRKIMDRPSFKAAVLKDQSK